MKKYTLLGNIFELEAKAHTLLSDYIQRIDTQAKKLGIADIIVENIKYKLIDKLHNTKSNPITEEEIVAITDSIGDPEEIFLTDGKKPEHNNTKSFDFKGMIDKHLGNEKPMIWGVCLWIAHWLQIPVSLVRLGMLVFVFIFGISIWIYPLGAIILQYKDQFGGDKKPTPRKPKAK